VKAQLAGSSGKDAKKQDEVNLASAYVQVSELDMTIVTMVKQSGMDLL
jgi:hypothetical protein